MHREIKKILLEIKDLNLAIIQEIIRKKNPNISISIEDTLSLKQTLCVYEWAENRGMRIIPYTEKTDESDSDNCENTDISNKVSDTHRKKKKHHKKEKYLDSRKMALKQWSKDFWDRAFASERSQNDMCEDAVSRKDPARVLSRPSKEKRKPERRGPKAHIIYIPMGGLNKKY